MTVRSMKQWITVLLLFAASISFAASEQLEAGNAKFDLGDGYEASFMLPDIGTPYVLDYAYVDGIAKNELLGNKAYGFTISSDDIDLASVEMTIWDNEQSLFIPPAGTEDSLVPDTLGPRIIIHKTISDALGYVGYDLQVGATGTDTSNAITGFFRCFPAAYKESDDLKGKNEVIGETGEFPASARSLQVFNSLMDSLKISGPDI